MICIQAIPQKALFKSLMRQTAAFGAWGISFHIVESGINTGRITAGIPAVSAILFVTVVGIAFIYATVRFLGDCDDFQRKCHLNAMSLSAGIGFIGAGSLILVQAANLPGLAEFGIGTLAALMFVTYIAGSLVGHALAR